MDLYINEKGIDLLKKAVLILKSVQDKKEMDEFYKKRNKSWLKKKQILDVQTVIQYLEFYLNKYNCKISDNNEFHLNIELAENIIKLLEACLGTDKEVRFGEYYNSAAEFLLCLIDLEKEEIKDETEAVEEIK